MVSRMAKGNAKTKTGTEKNMNPLNWGTLNLTAFSFCYTSMVIFDTSVTVTRGREQGVAAKSRVWPLPFLSLQLDNINAMASVEHLVCLDKDFLHIDSDFADFLISEILSDFLDIIQLWVERPGLKHGAKDVLEILIKGARNQICILSQSTLFLRIIWTFPIIIMKLV